MKSKKAPSGTGKIETKTTDSGDSAKGSDKTSELWDGDLDSNDSDVPKASTTKQESAVSEPPEVDPEKKVSKKKSPAESGKPKFDDSALPDKAMFRVDEVATYFSVSERTIRTWIQHGHLSAEKIVGVVRISRASILACRFARTPAERRRN